MSPLPVRLLANRMSLTGVTGVTVSETVATLEPTVPSWALYVNESGPW